MTSEDKRRIAACRVGVVGPAEFIRSIAGELRHLGFVAVEAFSSGCGEAETVAADIVVEYIGEGSSRRTKAIDLPLILPFDFVDGAGAIVVMPGDSTELFGRPRLRQWAAEYMAGYSAFWNIKGCDWLSAALPLINEGITSAGAMKTAALVCARIVANIAVGRQVKRFPRFYLCRNIF